MSKFNILELFSNYTKILFILITFLSRNKFISQQVQFSKITNNLHILKCFHKYTIFFGKYSTRIM